MSIRFKILMIFLVASILPLSILSLAAFADYGTILFYTQVSLIGMIGVMVSLLVAKSISEHLMKLSDAMRRISEGDFDVELKTKSQDEIGQFVRTFNQVAAQLKQQRQDIEESRRVAEQASLIKSEFIANISHETKTPMSGILEMSELLSDTDLTREQREYLNALHASAESMMSLLDDMLDFSRLESGMLEVEKVNFEFRHAFDDVLEPLRLAAASKGIQFLSDIHPDVPNALIGDPGRFRQVLGNLVSNAVKFTREGSVHVQVGIESMTQDDVVLRFRVRDTGRGVEQEKQAQIFNAFMQGDPAEARSLGGMGLGLTIAARLIQNMRGSIWLISPCAWTDHQFDPGSEFNFTLHLGIQRRSPQWLDREKDLNGLSVLLVSSHPGTRKGFQNLMTDWGMRVTAFDTGRALLDTLKSEPEKEPEPYAIVFESRLQDMDGYELASDISSTFGLFTCRMMILTGLGVRGDIQKCRQAGILGYLTKPVRAYEFRQAMLELYAADEELMHTESFLITRQSLRETRMRFRILIIEPEGEEVRAIEEKLVSWRHIIDSANTEREAKTRLQDRRYDVLLVGPNYPENALRFFSEDGPPPGGHAVTVVAGFAPEPKNLPRSVTYLRLDRPFRAEQLYETFYELLMKKESLDELPLQNTDFALPENLQEQPARICNLEEALKAVANDMELFSEIVEIFSADVPEQLRRLSEYLEGDDLEGVVSAAHLLKGSLANFYCDTADALITRIETLARRGEGGELPGLVGELGEISSQLIKDLQSVLQPRTSRLDA